MADLELRKRLAAAAGMAIDDQTLDSIYDRLMNIDKGSIPLTVQYVFSVDDEGQLEVSVNARCNMQLQKFTLLLRSDGKQLRLGLTESVLPMETAPKAKEEEPVEYPKPKKARAPRKSSSEVPPLPPKSESVTSGDAPSTAVRNRIAELKVQAEALYTAGRINSAQAKLAGVDTEAIDARR